MISLIQPNSTWVGRWNGLHGCKPGVYAIDAKPEVSLIGEESNGNYDEYESDKSDSRDDTERDEREVNVKRE